MERIEAMEIIAENLKEELLICNIGFPSRELYAVKDSATHFYMLGSMGMASSIGLGLALSIDRKVVVFDGDGSILMNMGTLATIYNHSPQNLILVVFDNECYGSTGSQCTYATTVDLGKVAKAVGFEKTYCFRDSINFEDILKIKGPVFVHIKVEPGNADVPIIDLSPEEIKSRFINEINSKRD
ncbi:MAG: sulfopyruvate decarboxylase subunit beta [Methanobacterium sp. BRmetb2]|nr:MAG: sulfopyruvate decarboxylase subunit beta [Methanobacterium sp. BRmetb2]